MENIYTLEEARIKLKTSDSTMRRWVRSGKIKSKKLGRQYRITESALQEFVDEQNKPKEDDKNV